MNTRVIVHTVVNPGHPGGVETVVRGLVSAYEKAGLSVHELRRDDCPLHIHSDRRRRLHIPSMVRTLAWLLRIRPAVVNIHFVTAEAIYFVLFKRLLRYRLVLSLHGSDLLLPVPISAEMMPSILKAADVITVVSQKMSRHLERMPGIDMDRVHVVSNGIDPDFWCPPPKPRQRGQTMLGVGRLETVKGFDLAIAAFAQIAQAHPDARLVLAGRGSQREKLEQQAVEAGLSGRVDFTGLLDREALRAAYRAADLLVVPSRSEGFPIALLEAMATGLPFVAADVGGVGEIATDRAGRCIPAEDVPALAKALSWALGQWDLQAAGRAARERATEFSIDRAESRYLDLIADVTPALENAEGVEAR